MLSVRGTEWYQDTLDEWNQGTFIEFSSHPTPQLSWVMTQSQHITDNTGTVVESVYSPLQVS